MCYFVPTRYTKCFLHWDIMELFFDAKNSHIFFCDTAKKSSQARKTLNYRPCLDLFPMMPKQPSYTVVHHPCPNCRFNLKYKLMEHKALEKYGTTVFESDEDIAKLYAKENSKCTKEIMREYEQPRKYFEDEAEIRAFALKNTWRYEEWNLQLAAIQARVR